jgi:hypothetical protein
VEQLQAIEAGGDGGLYRQFAIESEAQQLGLKCVVAFWPERVTVFETVVSERLTEINAGILGRHWSNRLCDRVIKNQHGWQVKC